MILFVGFYSIYSLIVQFLSMSIRPELAENQEKSRMNKRQHAYDSFWIVFKKQTVVCYFCFATCVCSLSLSSIWHKPPILNEIEHLAVVARLPLSEGSSERINLVQRGDIKYYSSPCFSRF